MRVRNLILPNLYRDSVVLMRLSQELEDIKGVEQATSMMGTPNNKSLLKEAGLLTDTGGSAGPNDLILALSLSSAGNEEQVVLQARNVLETANRPSSGQLTR